MAVSKRVILLVESSTSYGRGCLRGIARYARLHRAYFLHHLPHDMMEVLSLRSPWKQEAHGIIARIDTKRLAGIVRKSRLPTVDIMGLTRMEGVAVVDADHGQIMELALGHLTANGLEHVAYCGFPGLHYSDARQEAFLATPCSPHVSRHIYPQRERQRRTYLARENRRWPHDPQFLVKWLKGLPKPAGVLTCNDTRARHVLEACSAANIPVPGDISVVGVDNDGVICALCSPPLTSVDPNAEVIGLEAARVLDEMMNGAPAPEHPILVPPLGIEPRASSETQVFGHDDLNKAIRFIRENVGTGINVDSIVAHLGISRSTLERRFRKHMGCTLHRCILDHRMRRVKQLLFETTFPIYRIARMAGFRTSAHMIATFCKCTGMTPGRFRDRYSSTD